MIKENQRLLNILNVISDGLCIFPMLPLAFFIRFHLMQGGIVTVPFSEYLWLGAAYTLLSLFTYAAFRLYDSFRNTSLQEELVRLVEASLIDFAILLTVLFIDHGVHFSRIAFGIFLALSLTALGVKRIILRTVLRHFREKGYNQKHILLIGSGQQARRYLEEIRRDRQLGYRAVGYISGRSMEGEEELARLGGFDALEAVLESEKPDEVISAVDADELDHTRDIIEACEKSGVKLSIIPIYAEFMPSNPRFDFLNGIPLMNIRYIPLDNWANAFVKRAGDIIGSLLLIILTSPIMLICAVGVRLSSPGPVIFRQERIGLGKKPFMMYKFRSMCVNQNQENGWTTDSDSRKTPFGAFMRKLSLDELPQFFNVLRGDMSLVGPRPEVPFFVEQFKQEVPLYMVKHQVRPGITGWAQVHGLRGDTSIRERVEYDIYYIEHWSPLLDLHILLETVFCGKFLNSEKLK